MTVLAAHELAEEALLLARYAEPKLWESHAEGLARKFVGESGAVAGALLVTEQLRDLDVPDDPVHAGAGWLGLSRPSWPVPKRERWIRKAAVALVLIVGERTARLRDELDARG